MIRRAIEVLPDVDRWCVEFGAWDGRHDSNVHRLMEGEGWSGVLIEADARRFRDLQRTYAGNSRAFCFNSIVGVDESLEAILHRTPIPHDFDVLSIDVDGNDWHLWQSLTGYRPKLVVVEFNATIPNDIDFVQRHDSRVHQGSSLAAFVRLGKEKEYELIAVSDWNAFFVRAELFPLFGIEDNSPDCIHRSRRFHTRVFQLFDGTLVWDGCTTLMWHGFDFASQPVPKVLRYMPGTEPNAVLRWARRLYVRIMAVLRKHGSDRGLVRSSSTEN